MTFMRNSDVPDRSPRPLDVDGVEIAVPNPVTWSMMKLIAMRDCWIRSEDVKRTSEDRSFWRNQAIKHAQAQDVRRVIAMVTRDERDAAAEVLAAVSETRDFESAVETFLGCFQNDQGWGTQVSIGERTLAGWFH